jgi:hypothetical protein
LKLRQEGPETPAGALGSGTLAKASALDSRDKSAPGAAVSVRSASAPAFPSGPGYPQLRQGEALPPLLAQKVDGLPQAYLQLASSYRLAKSARPGRAGRAKRNVRLHAEVAEAITRQLITDKRQLGLRDLKPSHYVDAALSYAREVEVETLIEEADKFRDRHLGEEGGLEAPNHYSISGENDAWLDDMIDELMVAKATGLHGHMINVIIEAFLKELAGLSAEAD